MERRKSMPTEVSIEHEKLIYKMAQRFYGVPKEDLIQAGFLGLTKAYNKFDPSLNVKFSTYAYAFIFGEMYETATMNRPIHIKKAEMNIYKSVLRAKEMLEAKYNRSISFTEVCDFLKIDYNQFMAILNSLSEFVSVEDTELNLSRKEHIDDLILLKESLETLSLQERQVIVSRYMGDLSQNETAKVLGLSQVKVSRIEKRGKEKMKNFVAS